MNALLLILLACRPDAPVESPASPAAQPELHGTAPAAPVPLPEFAAYAHDGSPRSRADLLGHPTVVWFFPAAGTPG